MDKRTFRAKFDEVRGELLVQKGFRTPSWKPPLVMAKSRIRHLLYLALVVAEISLQPQGYLGLLLPKPRKLSGRREIVQADPFSK